MAYLEELLPDFRKGAKIRLNSWDKEKYIFYTGSDVHDNNDKTVKIDGYQLYIYEWELYQEPDPDWDYIIKNKCLCLFWNDDETAIGILKCKCIDGFLTNYGWIWENCRPVRKDEVTFYEDRKDE